LLLTSSRRPMHFALNSVIGTNRVLITIPVYQMVR
jgi:hypothetical protein